MCVRVYSGVSYLICAFVHARARARVMHNTILFAALSFYH